MNERQFPAGTTVRCNRCNEKGTAPREFTAVQENSKCWRIQDMWTMNTCGHMDAHWVFNSDIEE